MIQLVHVGGHANTPRKEYIVDTTDEMNSLPKEFGTMVLNLENSEIYVCNGAGTYVQITK